MGSYKNFNKIKINEGRRTKMAKSIECLCGETITLKMIRNGEVMKIAQSPSDTSDGRVYWTEYFTCPKCGEILEMDILEY
jgi:hypothetical protein